MICSGLRPASSALSEGGRSGELIASVIPFGILSGGRGAVSVTSAAVAGISARVDDDQVAVVTKIAAAIRTIGGIDLKFIELSPFAARTAHTDSSAWQQLALVRDPSQLCAALPYPAY